MLSQPLIVNLKVVDPKDPYALQLFTLVFDSIRKACSAFKKFEDYSKSKAGDGVDKYKIRLTDSIQYEDGNDGNFFSLRQPLHGAGHPQSIVKKIYISKLQVYAQDRNHPLKEVVKLPQAGAWIPITVEE